MDESRLHLLLLLLRLCVKWKHSPPKICSHSQNICLGCSSGQGGGQASPPCFFWPKTPSFVLPFSSSSSSFWLVFILLAGAEWPFMLTAVGYGCLYLCVRVWRPWHPLVRCLPSRPHTHSGIHSPCSARVWILCHTALIESCRHATSARINITQARMTSPHKRTPLWLSPGDIRSSHALVLQRAAAAPAEGGMSESCAWQIYDCKSLQFATTYGEKQQPTCEENQKTDRGAAWCVSQTDRPAEDVGQICLNDMK